MCCKKNITYQKWTEVGDVQLSSSHVISEWFLWINYRIKAIDSCLHFILLHIFVIIFKPCLMSKYLNPNTIPIIYSCNTSSSLDTASHLIGDLCISCTQKLLHDEFPMTIFIWNYTPSLFHSHHICRIKVLGLVVLSFLAVITSV